MKRLYDDAPFLVAGTRLGGLHGYDADGALSPLGGAVTGFAKAYKREQPEALVKAVDFAGEPEVRGARRPLDRGDPARPGLRRGRRWRRARAWSIGLAEQPAADGNPAFDMHGGTVYVVTGARRKHRLRHHGRPGDRRRRRHLPPARPDARRRTANDADLRTVHRPTRTASRPT